MVNLLQNVELDPYSHVKLTILDINACMLWLIAHVLLLILVSTKFVKNIELFLSIYSK